MIKVNWDVEELVALIDVYNRCKNSSREEIMEELAELSRKLIVRADRMGIVYDGKFRNMNGMMLMYQNVVFVATEGQKGMSEASSSMRAVYKMSVNAPEAFALILREFNKKYR